MSDLEANKKLVLEFIEALGRGDTRKVLDTYADDIVIETMGKMLFSGKRSKADAVGAVGALADMFPQGIEFMIRTVTAEGDRVLVEAVSNARHKSGKHYNNEYVFVARVRDGKFTEWREYLDTEHCTDVMFDGQRAVPA